MVLKTIGAYAVGAVTPINPSRRLRGHPEQGHRPPLDRRMGSGDARGRRSIRQALLDERWGDAVIGWMNATGEEVDIFPFGLEIHEARDYPDDEFGPRIQTTPLFRGNSSTMPGLQTEITEITTGLAMLGYQDLARALEVRPRHITHVTRPPSTGSTRQGRAGYTATSRPLGRTERRSPVHRSACAVARRGRWSGRVTTSPPVRPSRPSRPTSESTTSTSSLASTARGSCTTRARALFEHGLAAPGPSSERTGSRPSPRRRSGPCGNRSPTGRPARSTAPARPRSTARLLKQALSTSRSTRARSSTDPSCAASESATR